MSFAEILERFILPIGGMVGGLATLLIFLFSGRKRKSEQKKLEKEIKVLDVQADETVVMTPAKLMQMVNVAAGDMLDKQQELIDTFHEEYEALKAQVKKDLEEKDKRISELENKIDAKEASIANLEAENRRLKIENAEMAQKIIDQQAEIDQLRTELNELKQQQKKEQEC